MHGEGPKPVYSKSFTIYHESMTENDKSEALRAIPSVDSLLRTDAVLEFREKLGADRLAVLARSVIEELRERIQDASKSIQNLNGEHTREALLEKAINKLALACKRDVESGLRRVINASGVILHTNLGRAPLSEAARKAVSQVAAGYCTLEYETETGKRGRRGARVEQLLVQLTGAQDAIVVNNCAAAALLVLSALAAGGETIISRGELVEIGGDFRVPDVMTQSHTRLVEVGTTNRTRLSDYEEAITNDTLLVMRVHPSNYRIVGFTATPTLKELAELAHSADLPLYEDAGSGVLLDLSGYGLRDEPVISESLTNGADVVTFSGDKLLGAAQAGIIVGRRDLVEQMRSAPLYRALRADKLTLAALEATLESHQRGTAIDDVPALVMLALSPESLATRAEDFLNRLQPRLKPNTLRAELQKGRSAVGGGAAPTTNLETTVIALSHQSLSADELESALRNCDPPVISRVFEDRVLLDLRTVLPCEEEELFAILSSSLILN